MRSKIIAVALILCLGVSASNAVSAIYIDAASPNDPGTGTSGDPFRKIQPAINAAQDGDTVVIKQGVYQGIGNYNIDPGGRLITIRSEDPNNTTVVANTVIDPQHTDRGFNIHNGENENCVISGLTVINGSAMPDVNHNIYNGGGIYCDGSDPVISNCVIKNGYAEGSGGGICCYKAKVTIINCTLKNNVSNYYGGGISCDNASTTVTGCVITGNFASLQGGAVDSGDSNIAIFNCVVYNNNAAEGGGFNCFGVSDMNITNCTIVANSAYDAGGAIYCYCPGSWGQYNAIVRNSIIWTNFANTGKQIYIDQDVNGNTFVEYSDLQSSQNGIYDPCGMFIRGSGNIEADPCFALFDIAGDLNFWDFHLKSKYGRWNSDLYKMDFNNDGKIDFADFAEMALVWQQSSRSPEDLDYSGIVDWQDLALFVQYFPSDINTRGWVTDSVTSPCIDAGTPDSDWSMEIMPNGKRIDMGAYGGTNQASKSGNPADFNGDGIANFVDFADFGRMWGATTTGPEDLNNDGVVDIYDLTIFAEKWLSEIQ